MQTSYQLKQNQKRMRKYPTQAERALHQELKKYYSKESLKCQPIVGLYLPDFVIVPKLLVIEVDGSSHVGKEWYDARRTRYLNRCGLKVVRVTNEEVLADPEEVVSRLLKQTRDKKDAVKRWRSALGKANNRRSWILSPNNKPKRVQYI